MLKIGKHLMRKVSYYDSQHLYFKFDAFSHSFTTDTNQSQPFTNIDLYLSDPILINLSSRLVNNGGGIKLNSVSKLMQDYGIKSGSSNMMMIADEAERNIPILKQYDIYGRRIDEIDYHPSYHKLMTHGIENGSAAFGYNQFPENKNSFYSISHIIRAAFIYMENQLEPGHCCPIVMTAAAIPLLKRYNILPNALKKIYDQKYDSRHIPMEDKFGITIGMSMTEKQGGSDVRSNITIAKPLDPSKTGHGQAYIINGHKWFTSAAMSDGFFTLSKTDGKDSPTCFYVPRFIPHSDDINITTPYNRNSGFKVVRLKSKLGDRSNASSEIEYENAWGMMVGEPGKGVKTIIEMVQSTRLDCTLGSAGGARRALQVALNHCNTRSAFGLPLVKQPLMRNLLTDLCIESESLSLLAFHMASVFHQSSAAIERGVQNSPVSELFRIGVSVSKYHVTKRLPHFVYECMEIMGGNGYVEDFPMAKLFRQSPLNSIWEGSGNVIALDVLRGFSGLSVLMDDIKQCHGKDSKFDKYIATLESYLHSFKNDNNNYLSFENQKRARHLTDMLALAMQGSCMLRYGDPIVAEAFLKSRIYSHYQTNNHDNNEGLFGFNYGGTVVFNDTEMDYIIDRNQPKHIVN
eukprot:gene10382-13946_t